VAQFVEHRDAEAFAAIQHRYGPMVFRVCRRLLRDHHDAEDVYQATFLLFTQKAHQLRKPYALGPWLYGVDCHLKATTSVEDRERIEEMLKKFRGAKPTADQLRFARSLELLESIGNEDAKKLLTRLSEGAAESPLTKDAKATLTRWKP
jgi:DNA-directed RNA polymerase specialized sigma24 family protein